MDILEAAGKDTKELVSSGELILKGTNYSNEYAQKLKQTYNLFLQNGFHIREHALNRIWGRINQGKLESVEQVLDVLKTGTKYSDSIEGGLIYFKNGVSVHIAEDGFITTVIGNAKIKSTWVVIK